MEKIFLVYSIQVSIGLLLFYLLYICLFKQSTFLKTKRVYLYSAIIFSFLSPCMKLIYPIKNSFLPTEFLLPVVEINPEQVGIESETSLNLMPDLLTLFLIVNIIGSVLLFVRMLIQLISIFILRYKNETIEYNTYSVVSVRGKGISPFSFFRWIFIPNDLKSDKQLDNILLHETVHVDQKHSLDIILTEILCILFWWNPLVWQMKKEVILNLEYLADAEVLNHGIDSKYYQYLLLQTSSKNASIQLINNFNVSQLKKRIIMMNKEKTSSKQFFRYLLVLPLIGATMWFGSLYAESPTVNYDIMGEVALNVQDDDRPYTVVDEMPQFPGGEIAMMNYIGQNLKYPEDAAKDQIEGRLVIRFVVTKDGSVEDVQVLRSLSASCDAEGVRVVEAMPKWKPGKQNGEVVSVYYTLPILYKLQKDTETNPQ